MAVTVQQLLLDRIYTPEYIEQSKVYGCVHSCKMSRECFDRKDNLLKEGEKLRLCFENLSDKATHIIIMFVDLNAPQRENSGVYSLFPCFTNSWNLMSFHSVSEFNHIVIQIDTNSLPIQRHTSQNDGSLCKFQIICCSVVKMVKQEKHDNSLSFNTTFDPVFQSFDYYIPRPLQ